MADTNITMVRGDTLSFGIEYDGTDQPLESAYFTIRDSTTARVIKTLNNGIYQATENGTPLTGKYIVRVAPNDTRAMSPGVYLYEFEAGINNDVFTLLQGALVLEADYLRN